MPGILDDLWAEYAPRLDAVVRRRLPPALAPVLDAADIMQEAYLAASRRWPAFEQKRQANSSLSPFVWLYGVVMGRLVDEYRKHAGRGGAKPRNLPWPEASSVQLGLSLVEGGSPSSALAREDCKERMRQALEMLPDADRDILWMRHYDDLSFPEAAEALEIEPNTAAQRYVRALRKLREVWKVLEPADRSRL